MKTKTEAKPKSLEKVCLELMQLQRQKVAYLKSRIMISNRLVANVALTEGYASNMDEAERKKKFDEARQTIKAIHEGKEHCCAPLVHSTMYSFNEFDNYVSEFEKEMVKLAKLLPVYDWCLDEQQRGFGVLSLATIIGETGNLYKYENPGKVWARMGCAPYQKGNETRMGATWKSISGGKQGSKLTASEWEDYGYNPRRRSIAYLIGECLLKSNKGIYRERYDEAKERFAERHAKKSEQKGFKGWCHTHAMLLATKLLLKNLWIEWTQ